jgi:hypothetical protein
MRTLFLTWLASYVGPALVAKAAAMICRKEHEELTVLHVGLIASTLCSQYVLSVSGLHFPWLSNITSIFIYALSVLFAAWLVGLFGVWYALSALLQQLTIASISALLIGRLPILGVIFLVVPVFVLSHDARDHRWRTKFLLVSLWGIVSVLLFTFVRDIWLNASLHVVLGSVLIFKSVLYSQRDMRVRLASS